MGLDFRAFAPATLESLQRYAWPGNVRELQSAIKQAMLHGAGHVLEPEYLPENVRGTAMPTAASVESPGLDLDRLIETLLQAGDKNLYARVIEEVDRVLLARVLRSTHGHQAQASDILGLNRATLRSRLRTLGLAVDKVVTDEARPGETI